MGPGFGALEGIRVLDFSHMIAGPYLTLQLGYHGAEIIKVESKFRYDGFRQRRGDEDINAARPFADYNRNKLGVTINLKAEQGRALATRLAAISDIVVENFSADVMAKLGLSYQDLVKVKPDLIMISSQGMGQGGPYRDYVTWGLSAMAFSGMTSLWNHPGATTPVGSQTSHVDYIGGLFGLLAVTAALHHRAETGRGQYIELSQIDAAAYTLGPAFLEYAVNGRNPRQRGNTSAAAGPQGAYPCAGDDAWCALSVRSDAEWESLCAALGHPEWSADPRYATLLQRRRHRDELDAAIAEWTRKRTSGEVVATLQAAGIPAANVASGSDLTSDPHLKARGFLVEVDHPLMGRNVYSGVPVHFSETPGRVARHAPLLGQDNEYVFGELLDIDADEQQRLREASVIV